MTRRPYTYEPCLRPIHESIFTDCPNVGIPFQECLQAIYLSGLQHATAILTDKDKGKGKGNKRR